jgi:hypothetical protein
MKLALHIALNVVDPDAYNGWPGWLNGPCADAAGLAAELALAGFETQSLINERATTAAYEVAIRELAGRAQSGDTVLLHHSHHGGRADYGVFGGYHETFCLFNGELLDVDWMRLIAHFQTGVNVIAILDCCHAGGMDRAGMRAIGKARPTFVRARHAALRTPLSPLQGNFIALPACQADETCVETQISELAEVRGAWSWAFVRELQQQRDAQARVLLPDLYTAAARYCAEKFPAQHPRALRAGLNPDIAWQTRIA